MARFVIFEATKNITSIAKDKAVGLGYTEGLTLNQHVQLVVSVL